MEKGFSLIEIITLLFVISIVTISYSHLQKSLTHLQMINYIHQSYQTFVFAKLLALTDLNDTHIRLNQNQLFITKGNKTVFNLTYPKSISANINFRGYLGFKPNGNTKSPGTLQLSSKGIQKEIRLSVGIAKWSYYFDP